MAPIALPDEFGLLLDRLQDEDISSLDRLFTGAALRGALDQFLALLAQAAREEEGHSWADVGKVLNITRQAAQQRLGKGFVISVDASGNVRTEQNREKYVEGLREALTRLEHTGRAGDLLGDALREAEEAMEEASDLARGGPRTRRVRVETAEFVPVEVEREVEVIVARKRKGEASGKGKKKRRSESER